MTLGITVVDTMTVRLNALPEKLRQRLRVIIVRDVKLLAGLVRGKLAGGVLNPRSGRLLASVRDEMRESSNAIYGRVFIDEGSPAYAYAGIHEYGGITKPHMIYPKNARALHFYASGGREVFARFVSHPGSNIPERSYMRSSLEEMAPTIEADFTEARNDL